MPAPAKTIQSIVWGGLILIVLGIAAAFVLAPPAKPLPVYGTVPDFSLSDQDGHIISLADWRGQIHVVDLIFTRCPGQCLLMDATDQKIQSLLSGAPPVRLVSLTCDPDNDTPAVLKQYGERFGARPGIWTFLTGPKEQIHKLAVDGLKLAMVDQVHSTKLVLIDQQGRIRGYFDGETTECIPSLLAAIQSLAREK